MELDANAIFGNEAAEDEDRNTLFKYMVANAEMSKFWSLKDKLLIAESQKGVGKTALCLYARLCRHKILSHWKTHRICTIAKKDEALFA